ncbi:MAG: DUF3105 domain-containing protein, partial [Patescibacteria group bacterium]
MKSIKWLVLIVVVAAVLFGGYLWVKKMEGDKPGEAVIEQPASHIRPGDPIPGIYHSNPPVSGWHYTETAKWGIYDEEISDQILIHNLEHGGIWISYKPDVPPELVE